MRPFGDRVPAWPPLAGALALLTAALLATGAPLVAAIPAAVAGVEGTAIVLLAGVLTSAAIVGTVILFARLTRPVTGEEE